MPIRPHPRPALAVAALAALAIARPVTPAAGQASGQAPGAEPAAVTAASGAEARGAIRGRLDIRRQAQPAARRPDVSSPGSAGPRDVPDLRRGVVYLEAPAATPPGRAPARAVLDQRNETFVPHVLAITTGTVVDFPNSDRTYHNVFSLSKARRFDLGRYAAGRSKSVRFDRAGVVRVFCDIHSHMNAFVLVFDHPYFAVTETDGRFRIENVPAGAHTVIGWYEGEARASRPVTVPSGGVVDLDLVAQ